MSKTKRIVAVALLACGVAACGSSGSSPTTVVTPPIVAQEDQFGTGFGADYRASPNSEPATPVTSDIVSVSLTTEPVVVK